MDPHWLAAACVGGMMLLAALLWKRPQGKPWRCMVISGFGAVYYPADQNEAEIRALATSLAETREMLWGMLENLFNKNAIYYLERIVLDPKLKKTRTLYLDSHRLYLRLGGGDGHSEHYHLGRELILLYYNAAFDWPACPADRRKEGEQASGLVEALA